MSEILNYLNSPHLVANFQKIFGIEPQFKNSSAETVINSNGTESHKLVKKYANGNSILSNGKSECYTKASVNHETVAVRKQKMNDIQSKNINGLNNITNKLEEVSLNDSTKRHHSNALNASSSANTSGYSLRNRQIDYSNSTNSENVQLNVSNENKSTATTLNHNRKEQQNKQLHNNSESIAAKVVSNGKAKLDETHDLLQQQRSKAEDAEPNHLNKHSHHHRRQLSQPKKFVNVTDHTHIVSNTTIHSRFWYYFFSLGAAMGNEIFYCLFFPFWFWNVDGAIAR
jgi:hypothetical protein